MQNRRAFLFLLLAIALGVGAAFTAQRWLEDQRRLPEVAAKPTTQPVAVVRTDTSVGSVLSEREIVTVDWPLDYVPQGAYSQPTQLAGRVLRRPLASGEPVLESALLPEGARGGLISVIDPSRRAVSVKVDPVVGVAGFIVPGAHVDVMVTIRHAQGHNTTYTKIFLQDVQVLAIDQKLEEAKEGDPQLVQVVTLSVTPEQAEKLTFGAHEGKLQLALRNPSDRDFVETRAATASDLLGRRRRVATRRASTSSVEVIKGSKMSVKSF